MKKIHNCDSIQLSPVKMHWDDLEEIYSRMANGRKVEVISGEYEYKNLESLREKTKKGYLSQVKLTGRDNNDSFKNHISVDINPEKVLMYQDAESTETAAKIKEILNKNSPWYVYSPGHPAWYMISSAIGITPIWLLIGFSSVIKNIYLLTIMLTVGLAVMLLTFKNEPILGRTKIFTSLKKDNLNFWERNKDQIFRDLFVALITGAIGFMLGYFLPK